ncbi:MAG: hypothetical protein KAW41_01880 [Candidatus Diapherotrites archaeon]|nr:hypothetical protein [Candidatus Diapherotrites archaeon]
MGKPVRIKYHLGEKNPLAGRFSKEAEDAVLKKYGNLPMAYIVKDCRRKRKRVDEKIKELGGRAERLVGVDALVAEF